MNKPVYSWDASVFIAWLRQESTAPLSDIAVVADQIDANTANLLVSVIAYAEVLSARHSPDEMQRFQAFLRRSNVTVADTTQAIALRVEQIRSAGLSEARKIKTPDATFAATAIVHGANVLHSLDPDLLNLNGSAIVDGLRITRPMDIGGQQRLSGT